VDEKPERFSSFFVTLRAITYDFRKSFDDCHDAVAVSAITLRIVPVCADRDRENSSFST
jgi:hypothetical protein